MAEAKKLFTALPQSAFGLVQFKHSDIAITLPKGFDYELLKSGDTWKHIATRFKQGDIVHVRTEDHAFYAILYVRAADALWVQTEEMFFKQLGKEETVSSDGGYDVKWGSPKTLFGVYRSSDGERIKDGFQTKEAAADWLTEHLRKTAA